MGDEDRHQDLPKVVGYGPKNSADPDLALGYDLFKKHRHKEAEKPARQAVEHGHDAPGEYASHNDPKDKDNKSVYGTKFKDRDQRDHIGQAQLNAGDWHDLGELQLDDKDDQRQCREHSIQGYSFCGYLSFQISLQLYFDTASGTSSPAFLSFSIFMTSL